MLSVSLLLACLERFHTCSMIQTRSVVGQDLMLTRTFYTLECFRRVIGQNSSRGMPLPGKYRAIIPGSVHEDNRVSGICCSRALDQRKSPKTLASQSISGN